MNTHNRDVFEERTDILDADRRDGANRASHLMKTLSSDDLFHGEREIGIEHFGALYRLKITRQGKLILNK